METTTFRILDANANRAMEGLRVVEEFVRFELDDRGLTDTCKQLRHDLATALGRLSVRELHTARETLEDVGATIKTATELSRQSARDVAAASLKRVEQALRCLEEYGKLVSVPFASDIERLRYRLYTFEKSISITTESGERLATAQLYVLIDGRESANEFAKLVSELVQAGVHLLQLRDKQLSDRTLLERAYQLREITRGTQTLCIVNDRPDIAMLSQADGVHIGQDELSVKNARAIVGTQSLVGVSTHSLAQARQALLDGANYIGCGPTFPSTTKSFEAFPGLEFLQAIRGAVSLPAFAIGGITLENLPQVLATGFRRVAVSGAISRATEPAVAAKELLAMLTS